MSPQIKNILIFLAIGGAVIAGYLYFMGGDSADTPDLISSGAASPTGTPLVVPDGSAPGSEFLSLLLSVKSIQLNDAIFSNPAFQSLSDSSISLTPDGNEGRPNPFAPLYSEDVELVNEVDDTNITSVTPASNISNADKEAIIAVVLNRQKIFASGNIAQIKTYIKGMAGTAEEAKQIDAMTNKEILEGAKILAAFSLTEAQLRSEKTVWNMTDTEVKITAQNEPGGTLSVTVNKINGKWY